MQHTHSTLNILPSLFYWLDSDGFLWYRVSSYGRVVTTHSHGTLIVYLAFIHYLSFGSYIPSTKSRALVFFYWFIRSLLPSTRMVYSTIYIKVTAEDYQLVIYNLSKSYF